MASRIRDVASTNNPYQNREQVDRNAVGRTPQLDTRVSANTGGIDSLIKGLDEFAVTAKDKVARSTLRAAQVAGSQAGLSDQFVEREDATAAAEAYNRAGVEIYLNRTSADMSRRVQEVSADPKLRNDPVAMSHALEDLGGQIGKNVPASLYPRFMTAYNSRVQQALGRAQERSYEIQISENEGAFIASEVHLLAEGTNAARTGDDASLTRAREEYFTSIDGQVGLSISPADAVKKKLVFDRQVRSDAVVGDFLRTPSGARLGFVRDFIKNNPLGDILSAEEVDGIKRDMMTAWDVNENLEDKANLERATAGKAQADNVLAEFHLAPTAENYTKYVAMPGVSAASIKAARNYLVKNINKSDPVMQSYLEDAIYSGDADTANNIMNSPEGSDLISRVDMQKYRRQMAENASGGGFEKTEAYKEMQIRIKEDFRQDSIHGSGLSRQGNMIRQQIYDKLRTDYPKYQRGEIPFDDVDPVRMYNLKKQNLSKGENGQAAVQTVKTANGNVHIPKTYLEDPQAYQRDIAAGTIDPSLATVEVQKYVVEHEVNQMKQQKAKATAK